MTTPAPCTCPLHALAAALWEVGPDPFLGDDPHRPVDPPAVTVLVEAGLAPSDTQEKP